MHRLIFLSWLLVPGVAGLGHTTLGQPLLTPHAGNPIITRGAGWDSGIAFFPEVLFHDGLYYAFYCGSTHLALGQLSIGYATSVDGLIWEKNPSNPVFQGDGTGFDALSVCTPAVVMDGDTWVLYYDGTTNSMPGPGIGRATAQSPDGPWARSAEPVLTGGGAGTWDSGLTLPDKVLATGEGYVMYYTGSFAFTMPLTGMQIGRATSADGINWIKYNDPNSGGPFSESDPVLDLGPAGDWDANVAWAGAVRETEAGWEMFYSGNRQPGSGLDIGYARSWDGIRWTKSSANPILVHGTENWGLLDLIPKTVMVADSTTFLYYHGFSTGLNAQMGVATGPAPSTLYFAQVGSGEGVQSDLVLPNPSASSSVSGRVDFLDENGDPLELGLAEGDSTFPSGGGAPLQLASSVDFSVDPLDALTLSTDGLGDLVAGSAVVTSYGSLGGVVRFQIPGIGIAGVGTSQIMSSFIIPVRKLPGGLNTGVAIYNARSVPVTLDLTLRSQGEEVASAAIQDFPGHGHLARFIDELFAGAALDGFEGTLVVETEDGRIAATALELGSQAGQFTTLPVTPLE